MNSEKDDSLVKFPDELCGKIDEFNIQPCKNDAISYTFEDIRRKSSSENWIDFVAIRAILATKNEVVDAINDICLNKMDNEEIIIPSADSTVDPGDAALYPVEYINTLQTSGIPPHRLRLKKNAVIMLMRNLNIREGLCNGTRLIIDDIINDRLLKATIANGEFKGRQVLIPKINTQPADENLFGFEWRRTQFPVKVAFSMTIHKSQGQTLRKVAVWLQEPCFGHGQLYVAASRVGDPENIKFYIMSQEGQPDYVTKNVVYKELLQ